MAELAVARQTAGDGMSKLIVLGLILIVVMLVIWVVWGEAIAARVRRERRLDDEGLHR